MEIPPQAEMLEEDSNLDLIAPPYCDTIYRNQESRWSTITPLHIANLGKAVFVDAGPVEQNVVINFYLHLQQSLKVSRWGRA
ncbi:unnamed protein product [Leptidea sinapis]|uniref:Uncharacterized protein n=1 Tax=Leptidea sinapis TaxID=189913 RepID=A0A5E4PTS6_9NEOP|nr:unnamed protein product [Leptidea sinapis]